LIFLTKLHEGPEETQCIRSCMRHFESKINLAEPKKGTTCPSYKLLAKSNSSVQICPGEGEKDVAATF
jgi:hypothetical protein